MDKLACLALCLITLLPLTSMATAALYPGEQLVKINEFETLIKFVKADPKKPLVIFVPGDSHLARIAYGYPKGDDKDFLAYWLQARGYSFLGVSYPSDNPVYSKVHPSFTIQDWGKQIAAAADLVIKEHHLSRHIIVAGWSMGGSIEEAVNVAAKQHGLIVDAFIGLSAVPPLPYVMQSGPYSATKILPNQLADRSPLTPVFISLLNEQGNYNQHTVISNEIYTQEFIGNIPVAITAEGYHFRNGEFTQDINLTLSDGGVYNFAETPWIALIRDDAPSTAKISLIDPASWNFLRAEMINSHYLSKLDLSALSTAKWKALSTTINELPDKLTLTVHGNHFFFVGQKGAKETAEKIEVLASRVKILKMQLEKL